ncbi:hypothetical protein AX14_013523 [Amanita brunnescens Koide BX004]|nr:hypothetical protein AX14_013523 [Amanita brunnescens Koide BX004]
MVKFNFPSLFLILTAAATLVFANAPALHTIVSVTGLYISNQGGLGADVTSSYEANNGFTLIQSESGGSWIIQGESGWYINPNPDYTSLVWSFDNPFQWNIVPFEVDGPVVLINTIYNSVNLNWIPTPNGVVTLGQSAIDNQFTISN